MERETIRPVKEVYSQTNIPEPKELISKIIPIFAAVLQISAQNLRRKNYQILSQEREKAIYLQTKKLKTLINIKIKNND